MTSRRTISVKPIAVPERRTIRRNFINFHQLNGINGLNGMSNVVLIPYTPIMNYGNGHNINNGGHNIHNGWFPSNHQQSYIYMNNGGNNIQQLNGNGNLNTLPYLNPLSLNCWMYQQGMFGQHNNNRNMTLMNNFQSLLNIQ
jgi:hypothetical protein